ncbi:DUF429 domain-containing protein [Pseudokineococcus sp. 1T1Z-3]|uniref:DUF429 domain-containing protein n=1 Tax=Pseudokineococcus sp. 1T1Z-3 TaxID=3132745 RepID=UPI00309EBEAE
MARVLGVDGCRGRWAACAWEGPGTAPVLTLEADPAGVLAAADRHGAEVVGLDLPLGLVTEGERAADAAARAYLLVAARRRPGPNARGAASRVFVTPVRQVVAHGGTYAQARELARSLGAPAPSAQAYALLGHVRAWDAVAAERVDGPGRLVEVHPELSFTEMAGRLLAPKRSARGARQRLTVLAGDRGLGCSDAALTSALEAADVHIALDDALDAMAAAWSAWRVVEDVAVLVPEHEQWDGRRAVRIHV